jgi:hypothetical protein
VIVLSLLLTALGTIVLVSQQYDQYQQTASNMAQYRNQQSSENLVAVSPGLAIVNSTICGNSKATPEYNCYDATISNRGTIGIQITRIYINSTGLAGSGCSSPNPQPCILNPISPSNFPAPYTFDQANQFINTGQTNYTVAFALPTGVALPTPALTSLPPQNSIVIVTSRGNVFSFQWPFQTVPFLPTSAFSSGNMKVAYQSTGSYFNSANEPSFTGKAAGSGYCHTEQSEPYPAAAGYAEELTGINGVGVTGNTLYFVTPWITTDNSEAVVTSGGSLYSGTTLYIYVVIVNTGSTPYTPTAGSLDLTWYGSNHIDGYLLGVYYNGGFYAKAPSIAPGAYYYAIFKITYFSIGNQPWDVQAESPSVMMWGSASITNALTTTIITTTTRTITTTTTSTSESGEDQSFFSGTILVSGLWLRYEASTGSCA